MRTCFIIPAAHHIPYGLLRIQRFLVFHYAERGDAPVDSVHPQVGRHVVGQVIFILRPPQRAGAFSGENKDDCPPSKTLPLTFPRFWMYCT